MPSALASMDVLRPIDFTTALVHLHGAINREVKIAVNYHGHFFGCGLQARLLCVQTLPPDYLAVRLVLEGGQGLFLDPADLEVFLGGSAEEDESWIEFHTRFGLQVTVETAPRES